MDKQFNGECTQEQTKACSKCEIIKPLSSFHAHKNRPRGAATCKRCKAISQGTVAAYDERMRRVELVAHGLKVCGKCKQSIPRTEYGVSQGRKDGLNPYCRTCKSQAQSKEAIAAQNKRYAKQNKESLAEKNRVWRLANADVLIVKKHEYRLANPQKMAAAEQLRKARLHNAPGVFTEREWRELCDHYGNRCLRCGATDKPLTVDHVQALARGGSNGIENIQPLCKSCNCSKGARHNTDYRKGA